MLVSIVLRALAFLCFTGFGIAWMSNHDTSLAIVWIASFVAAVLLTLWYAVPDEDRAALATAWERIPGFSKNPDDFR